ncbi:MAG: alpha/beta hydrolase [Candidatus Margulisiibacteriota bacterium]
MFKITNRNYDKSIVLLPGWATDYRIFEKLDIPYDYIQPVPFDPNTFETEFLEFAGQKGIKTVSFLGWSLGGNCAADFTAKHPEMLEELILVSVKEKYDKEGIDKIKELLNESKKAYLYKFYHDCFSGDEKEMLPWFKKELMKEYLDRFTLGELFKGLDFLLDNPLRVEAMKGLSVRFIFGMKDKVVPAKDVIMLKNKLPEADFELIDNSGHMPLFSCRSIPANPQ